MSKLSDAHLAVTVVVDVIRNLHRNTILPMGKVAITLESWDILLRYVQRQQHRTNLVEEEAFAEDGMEMTTDAKLRLLHIVHSGQTKVVKAQIHSASTNNTMPESTLQKLFPNKTISKVKTLISLYGNETMHATGQVTLCHERKGKFDQLDFFVDVPEGNPPLAQWL